MYESVLKRFWQQSLHIRMRLLTVAQGQGRNIEVKVMWNNNDVNCAPAIVFVLRQYSILQHRCRIESTG